MENGSSNKPLLIGVIVCAVLIFAGLAWAILTAPPGGAPSNNGTASFHDTASTPFVGPADAAVTVHIYGDFQCPACKAAEPGLEAAMSQFKDRVKFVWKDFPLLTIHRNARAGANAARCAQDQGKFWEMHDLLYANQETWAESNDPKSAFAAYASQLGLDVNSFNSCVASSQDDDKVMADENEGLANGVNATPTFYVNDAQYVGLSADQWAPILNAALASASSSQ
ncbi:MAG TPA: thioredoxin domain-containing protein [Verrucomicrobiae bacterium]|nr:thioredoxin domain-containing protein [Verrucomicrobiae bacterium]